MSWTGAKYINTNKTCKGKTSAQPQKKKKRGRGPCFKESAWKTGCPGRVLEFRAKQKEPNMWGGGC